MCFKFERGTITLSRKLRILGIVPYDDMKTLMLNVASEYSQIEMHVEVGGLDDAVLIAKQNAYLEYDLILSRGGLFRILKRQNLPMLDIDFSPYDILRALRLSNNPGSKIAMVVNANIGASAQTICDILGTEIDIIQANSISELEPILTKLLEEKYTMVLADFSAHKMARHLGLNSILITSGPESIRHAIQAALTLYQNTQQIQEENFYLKQILNNQSGIAIFSTEGEMIFSTLKNPPSPLMDKLKNLVSIDNVSADDIYSKNIQNTQYSIRRSRIRQGEHEKIAFYVETRRLTTDAVRTAVHFYSRQDVKDAVVKHPFSILDRKSVV